MKIMTTFRKLLILFILSGIFLLIIEIFALIINDKKENTITKEKYLNIAKVIVLDIDNPNEINKIYKKYKLLNVKC